MLEPLNRIGQKLASIKTRCRGEPVVEVGILLEGQTFLFVLDAAEVPQNFLPIRAFTENLWYKSQTL